MIFEPTKFEGLWSDIEQDVVTIRSELNEWATGASDAGDGRWLPITDALPEDHWRGHPALLGPYHFELDGNDPNVVIRFFPDADFSPAAFLHYAEDRIRAAARQGLSSTDWAVLDNVETGAPIPQAIVETRQAIRDAVDQDFAILDASSPSERPDFTPTMVAGAVQAARKRLLAKGSRRAVALPPTPGVDGA